MHFGICIFLSGCRDEGRDQPDPAAAAPAAVVSVVESADSFAARAADAMDQDQLPEAGELFARATTAPDSPTHPASSTQRFDWQCKSALAFWLAGDVDRARAICDPKAVPPGPDADGQHDYLAAFRGAMDCYRRAGWPMNDPDRMVDVLAMAPALQLWALPLPADWVQSQPLPCVQIDWKQVARLPELLAACTAMDQGRLNLKDYQLVAVLGQDARRAAWPDFAQATAPDSSGGPDALHFVIETTTEIMHPAPVRGDAAELTRPWLAWLGERQTDLFVPQPENTRLTRLMIGVSHDASFVGVFRMYLSVEGPSPGRPVIKLTVQDERSGQRLLAGLKVLDSAMPDGATPVATRQQADRIVEAMNRLAPNRPIRIQPQDNFFWVLPSATPGQSRPEPQPMIPLVAGWLAYHDWQEPAAMPHSPTTQVDQSPDDDAPPPSQPPDAEEP